AAPLPGPPWSAPEKAQGEVMYQAKNIPEDILRRLDQDWESVAGDIKTNGRTFHCSDASISRFELEGDADLGESIGSPFLVRRKIERTLSMNFVVLLTPKEPE